MKAGWRDAPLALRDLAVSNMHNFPICISLPLKIQYKSTINQQR